MISKSKSAVFLLGVLVLMGACAQNKGPTVGTTPPTVTNGSGNGSTTAYPVTVAPNLAQSLGVSSVCAQVLNGLQYVSFSSGACSSGSNVENSAFILGLSSQDYSSYFLNDNLGNYVGEMDWNDDSTSFTLQYLCTGEFAVNGSGGPSIPSGGKSTNAVSE